jgi:hypothetical protein
MTLMSLIYMVTLSRTFSTSSIVACAKSGDCQTPIDD